MQLINHLCFKPEICTKEYYQAIYTSQSYGTFYVVYAEFTTEEDNDNYYVKNINLKLVNYKGLINLGIADATLIPIKDEFSGNSKGALLDLTVKAFEQDTFTVKNYDVSHPYPKNDSEFLVNRELVAMHPNNSPLEGNIFDEEFYYRDGIDLKGQKGLSLQERKINNNVPNEILLNNITNEGLSFICPVGRGKIL